MFKLIAASAAALLLLSCDTAPYDPYLEFDKIASQMISSYDIEVPSLIVEDFDGMPEVMGKTVCSVRSGSQECRVIVKPCVLELRHEIMENLFAHEIAHYINAKVNRLYDHGPEWAEILSDNGFEVIETYRRSITSQCG